MAYSKKFGSGTGIVLSVIISVLAFAVERPTNPEDSKIKESLQEVERAQQIAPAKVREYYRVQDVNLVADTSPVIVVKDIAIEGNTLLKTQDILNKVPQVFNNSPFPIAEAPVEQLYDLTSIKAVIASPGKETKVSMRSIQGFTQYVVNAYRQKNYAGIYVYVPAEAIVDGVLTEDGVLPVAVIEGIVSDVNVQTYDSSQKPTRKGYLRKALVQEWSPVKKGEVVNQKKLNDYVDQLNLNPDRYVSAEVSKGQLPNSMAVDYKIYEANPWHWFVQTDNSGSDDTEWTPRYGVINTNTFGYDDTFTAIYQARPDSTFNDDYSIYSSYEIPILTPRLRLKIFGAYNEFSSTSADGGDIRFLGNGYFYGGKLSYTLFQADKWFFDLTGGYSRELSRVTPSLFPEFLSSKVYMDLVSYGFNIHRQSDMHDTSFSFERVQNRGGSDQDEFSMSRTGAEKFFAFDTFAATHSQYLTQDKIDRITGLVRYIYAEDRLTPAKMTAFGGMYTVRGYDEYEIIADGGVIASAQYEYDLVRHSQVKNKDSSKSWLRKLAPAAFVDYGLATIKDPIEGEDEYETLVSVGVGLITEIGDHLTGTIYYGIPLKSTQETEAGEGRVHVGVLARW